MMNAKKIEKWILLEQTGELSSRKKRILDACPGAQAKREELASLLRVVPVAGQETSPWAVTQIHSRLQGGRRSRLLPTWVWQSALALAACLMLVFTVFDLPPDPSPSSVAAVAVGEVDVWNVQFEEDLAELEGLILAISDTPLDIMEM